MINKTTLNRIAREYDPRRDFDRYAIEYEKRLIVQNAIGKSLLEIGCADGTMTEYFARHMQLVETVEGSSYYLRKLEKHVKGSTSFSTTHLLKTTQLGRNMIT